MRCTVVTLIAAFILGLLSVPLVAQAQGVERVWRLAVLTTLPRPVEPKAVSVYNAFLLELRKLGYIEGQNVIIEWRETEGKIERRRDEISTLVAWKPDVVVAVTPADAKSIRAADANLPVVLAGAGYDLVALGLVDSLARPGGNVTGSQMLQLDTVPRRLQIFKELMPHLQRVAVLHVINTDVGPMGRKHIAQFFAELESSSRALSVRVRDFPVYGGDDLDRVFADMKRDSDVVMIDTDPFLTAQRSRLVALASRHGLPTMHDNGGWVEAGALVSYGPDLAALWRRAAHFVDRIFKGDKPANMPVEQPRNFELFINLKTARALHLEIPKHLLLLADRVIE